MLNRKPKDDNTDKAENKPTIFSSSNVVKTKKNPSEVSAYKNIKKDETPSSEDENLHNTVINEMSLGHEEHKEVDVNGETKTNIPEGKPSEVELSEPNTVRSILDRAKEVLKTLDYDNDDSSLIAKRGGITRNNDHVTSSRFVNETAKAVLFK